LATRKQKEDLVKVLKFTPRDIEITLSGYGGEIVMGRITEAAYDFWQDRDDLDDFVYDWDGEMDVPADAQFCTDGAWHDVDDICHESGCEAADSSYVTVQDLLEDKTLFESACDVEGLSAKGIDISSGSVYRPSQDLESGTCVFLGQSFEKGLFFSATVRITEPFDVSRLSISYTDCDGWRLISSVEYAGEDLDGSSAYSTNGKGSNYNVFRVERDEEEVDGWDPATELDKISAPDVNDGEPEFWEGIETTPWHPMDIKPHHRGEYQVLTGTWPFPGRAEWTGKKWKAVSTTDTKALTHWRGLTRAAE
jgi:hypothetical protein